MSRKSKKIAAAETAETPTETVAETPVAPAEAPMADVAPASAAETTPETPETSLEAPVAPGVAEPPPADPPAAAPETKSLASAVQGVEKVAGFVMVHRKFLLDLLEIFGLRIPVHASSELIDVSSLTRKVVGLIDGARQDRASAESRKALAEACEKLIAAVGAIREIEMVQPAEASALVVAFHAVTGANPPWARPEGWKTVDVAIATPEGSAPVRVAPAAADPVPVAAAAVPHPGPPPAGALDASIAIGLSKCTTIRALKAALDGQPAWRAHLGEGKRDPSQYVTSFDESPHPAGEFMQSPTVRYVAWDYDGYLTLTKHPTHGWVTNHLSR